MNDLKAMNSSKANLIGQSKNTQTSNFNTKNIPLSFSSRVKSSKGLHKNGTDIYSVPSIVESSLKKKFGSGSPQYSFGSEQRVKSLFIDYMSQNAEINSKSIKGIPGPGNYNPKLELLQRQASSWSLVGKDKYDPTNKNPGPGSYDLNKTPNKKNPPKTKFGSSKKEFSLVEGIKDKKSIPGPTYFKSFKDFGKEGKLYSFGKEEKFYVKRPFTPGVVNGYNENSKIKGRITHGKTTFGNGFNNTIYKFNNNPGPASYNTPLINKAKAPSAKMGTSKRKDEFLNVINNSPGPAQINFKSTLNDAVSYRFLKDDKLKPIKSSTPGPGEYDV